MNVYVYGEQVSDLENTTIYDRDHAKFETMLKRYGLSSDEGITSIATRRGNNGGIWVFHFGEDTGYKLVAIDAVKIAYEVFNLVRAEYAKSSFFNFENRHRNGVKASTSIEYAWMKRRDNEIVRIHVPNEANYVFKVTRYGVWLADITGEPYRDRLTDYQSKMFNDLQFGENLLERSTEKDGSFRYG